MDNGSHSHPEITEQFSQQIGMLHHIIMLERKRALGPHVSAFDDDKFISLLDRILVQEFKGSEQVNYLALVYKIIDEIRGMNPLDQWYRLLDGDGYNRPEQYDKLYKTYREHYAGNGTSSTIIPPRLFTPIPDWAMDLVIEKMKSYPSKPLINQVVKHLITTGVVDIRNYYDLYQEAGYAKDMELLQVLCIEVRARVEQDACSLNRIGWKKHLKENVPYERLIFCSCTDMYNPDNRPFQMKHDKCKGVPIANLVLETIDADHLRQVPDTPSGWEQYYAELRKYYSFIQYITPIIDRAYTVNSFTEEYWLQQPVADK